MDVQIEEAIPEPRSPERESSFVISGGGEFQEPTTLPPSPGSPSAAPETVIRDMAPESLTSLLESLQSELQDVVVDLHRTKTKLAALERESEITKAVVSKKIDIGDAFKKQVELLTDTVKNLTMSSRFGKRRGDTTSMAAFSMENAAEKVDLETSDRAEEVDTPIPIGGTETPVLAYTAEDDVSVDDIVRTEALARADKGKSKIGKDILLTVLTAVSHKVETSIVLMVAYSLPIT